MEKNILILGSGGMLGQALVELFSKSEGYRVTAWDKGDIDITDFPVLEDRIKKADPAIVINAAAYNAVDLCEENDEEYQKALTLNRDVPKELARLSETLKFHLIHYSTDYVFDGTFESAGGGCQSGACCGGNCHGNMDKVEKGYREDALPNPLSRYGMTKYLGEEEIRKAAKNFFLIRTSKLFGKPAATALGKKSFFGLMLDVAKKNSEVKGIDDEKSCFTYVPDLARATQALIEDGVSSGIYHLVNPGAATWYEGMVELYRQAGLADKVKVIPVGPEAFQRSAKRPHFSVLSNTKRPPLRPYQEALKDFLQNDISA